MNRTLLNKITGCKSRTVPPLYVPRHALLMKISHWVTPGKAERKLLMSPASESTSQKTYAMDSPPLCVLWRGAFVAEKRLRHPLWVPQFSIFRR